MLTDIKVGDDINVMLNGQRRNARVRRIGTRHRHPDNGTFVMLTLDIGGELAYAVAHESEVGQ